MRNDVIQKINEKNFKSYDIRGIYPDQINGEAAFKIGQAFANILAQILLLGAT